jgi:uncharacterized protein (TIGR02266 family)
MTTDQERDEVLRSLLVAAAELLCEPQVCLVDGGELRGHLAFHAGTIDCEQVRDRRLSLSSHSVVARCALDNVAFLGPAPTTDPCVDFCSAQLLEQRGLVAVPLSIADRTGLLLGHPRDRVTRGLRDRLCGMAREVSVELGRPAAEQPAAPSQGEQKRSTNPYGHRVVSRDEGAEGKRESVTNPYGHRVVAAPKEPPVASGQEVFLLTQPKSDPPPAAERRRCARFPVVIQVTHVSEHNFFTGFTEDMGEGGLFIATYGTFEVGERLELELALPGQPEPWVVPCEVRWLRVCETPHGLIPGIGVRFLELTPQMREQIQRFMRKRPPLHTEG